MFLSVVAFAAVVLGFVTAVLGLGNQRKIKAAAVTTAQTAVKVESISVSVDGRLSELIDRQAQLLDALRASGTPVPPRPEKTPGP